MLRHLAIACAWTSIAGAAPSKRALFLEPEAPDSGHHLFAAEHAADFPAVSEDGSTIAQLYHEGEDFTGAPITTLVLWSKTGARLASFRLGGFTDPNRPPDHAGKIAAYEWPILAAANTQLSRHTWNPLAIAKACGDDGTVCFPDGLKIRYDADKSDLVITAGKRKPRRIPATFPSPGQRAAEEDIPGGGCGETRGLAGAYGSLSLGIVFLDQTAMLGGDSCVGQPTSDSTIAIKVP